mgnify:CR=1 FL=1
MLSGLRVVEFEGLGPAPFAAMMLAEMGAQVIVIHRPGAGNPVAGTRNLLDRGKRSIVLDLKSAEDVAIARALIQRSDALIEGYRPGVMERLGLGPEAMQAANPRLVYGRMTGWGQAGPRAQEAGHDLNYIATSGALWYAGAPGTPPVTPATLVGDVGGGALYLVAGMLAGLIRAGRSGRGGCGDCRWLGAYDGAFDVDDALGQPEHDARSEPARRAALEPRLRLRLWWLAVGAMP